MNSKKFLIVITGPTAVGKTALSISLAREFQCEVLSADSRQFYKEMAIGTAKPTVEEMNGVKHHFIDNLSIHDDYTAGKFEKEALKVLDSIYKTNNIAILIGGSGLFVDAVCNGFDDVPSTNEEVRNNIIKSYEEKGLEFLQEKVKEIDPEYFNNSDINNPHRLMRCIEVFESTGKKYSSFRSGNKNKRSFTPIFIGLNMEREKLYERINLRVDLMVEAGLLDEVESLREFKDLKPLKTVGYQEFYSEDDTNTAIEKVKQNTRRFAKRQITWFRKNKETNWFEPQKTEEIIQFIISQLNG